MSTLYNVRPSSLLGIVDDDYTAYCFDEACAYISSKIKKDEKPVFKKKQGNMEKQNFSKPSDLYKSMGFERGQYVAYK